MRIPLLWVACCCAVLTACGGSPPTGPTKSPTLSRTRFMAFGDSFTLGEVTSPIASSGLTKLVIVPTAAYPSVLQGRLTGAYPTQSAVIAVINSGVVGETLLEGRDRFPGELQQARPEAVLIMEGVNGLNIAGPDISTDLVAGLARTAQAAGARVFVGSMLPQVSGRPKALVPANDLVTYNTRLQAMSRQDGHVFVDVYNAMLGEAGTLIGVDGLHPTEVGYKRIADVFFAAIQANLEVK